MIESFNFRGKESKDTDKIFLFFMLYVNLNIDIILSCNTSATRYKLIGN